jgi:hypothetical protein
LETTALPPIGLRRALCVCRIVGLSFIRGPQRRLSRLETKFPFFVDEPRPGALLRIVEGIACTLATAISWKFICVRFNRIMIHDELAMSALESTQNT